VAFDDLLINTCTVRRFTEGVADAYGTLDKTWADHLVDQDCRLVASSGREIQVGAQVVVADHALFINDADITERDRVVIDGVTYEVIMVMSRQDGVGAHHLHCFLRTVR